MNPSPQDSLKCELQTESDASKLEYLVGALLSRLLDVPIAIARSGFQYGGDAGPAGQLGRRFRIECKKYRDTSHINERELLGEIDQALSRDHALEAWVLVSTTVVSEQTRQSLVQHGEQLGIPILIFDWRDNDLAPLAALCSTEPDLVEFHFSSVAAIAARSLKPASQQEVERIRRELQSWCLGFDALRKRSHQILTNIWTSPRESTAALGQNAAGGFSEKTINRQTVQNALGEWWTGPAEDGAPAVVVGLEGTGKTWAALNWLVDQMESLPIVLVVPSSAVMPTSGISDITVKSLLAERMHEIAGVRGLDHWHQRLDRLLQRPDGEGPVVTIFFDGLNQDSTVQWLRLFKVLQAGKFSERVRLIVTTRQHHYNNKLSKLAGLVVQPVSIPVGLYDDSPGGELDQMLAHERLARADLHPDVLTLARTPRLFDLVVRFRATLGRDEGVTVHRLLWEYGRDTFGFRAERSFTEQDWREWLGEIAADHREGITRYSTARLSQTVARPDLAQGEVYARLSDVVDGRFTSQGPSGEIELVPEVIAHALGAALLRHLDDIPETSFGALDREVKRWLDPIGGLDEPSEILRAAVAIVVEQERAAAGPLPGVLVTSWLQCQNLPEGHSRELGEIAVRLPGALLDAVEHSATHIHNSARLAAVNGLRKIPRTDHAACSLIVERTGRWLQTIYRDIHSDSAEHQDLNKTRSKHLKKRVGTAVAGPIRVLGHIVELSDHDLNLVHQAIPSILEEFPFTAVIPVLENAAIALAVSGNSSCWDALRWLCLTNEIDPQETASCLRELSANVERRNPEPGIHPDLAKRIAALLLWLPGYETDDLAAADIDPRTFHSINYQRNYLANPSRSVLPLERRHADAVVSDQDSPILSRAKRIGELWLDPAFSAQSEMFEEELRAFAAALNLEELAKGPGRTIDDHHFELIEPALARCAPDLLASLIRQRLELVGTCSDESWYWKSTQATEYHLLTKDITIVAGEGAPPGVADADKDNIDYARTERLLIEIYNLDAVQQFKKIIDADLKFITTDLGIVLRTLTLQEVDHLVNRYMNGTEKQKRQLITLFSIKPRRLSEQAWAWLTALLGVKDDENMQGLVFKTLSLSDLEKFGEFLLEVNWSWEPSNDMWASHYGSLAVIEALRGASIDQLVDKIAPWLLLEAARRRGGSQEEVRLASAVFGEAIMVCRSEEPDPGSDLTVEMAKMGDMPFTFSLGLRDNGSEAERFQRSFDAEKQLDALRLAVDTAVSRIRETRQSGAKLYLATFSSDEFVPVIRYAPEIVDGWLSGLGERSVDFRRRVRLAEGAYLGLCEALLTCKPGRGVALWHALRDCLMTRFVGSADIDELIHIVFRVPHSPEVINLRRELVTLGLCCTDRDLLDLVIAAKANQGDEYLETIIREDRESPYAWRKLRASALEGFALDRELPVAEAWPDGEIIAPWNRLALASARCAWANACARYWWTQYLEAEDDARAYASWVLFVRSVDRRVFIWWENELTEIQKRGEKVRHKIVHARINRDVVRRAAKKREERFEQQFLRRRIVQNIGPWC